MSRPTRRSATAEVSRMIASARRQIAVNWPGAEGIGARWCAEDHGRARSARLDLLDQPPVAILTENESPLACLGLGRPVAHFRDVASGAGAGSLRATAANLDRAVFE